MNAPLKKVAVACLVLFGLLLVNVNYVQVVKADNYREATGNSRVLTRSYEFPRGGIALGAQGAVVVARSTRTDGPLTYLRSYPAGPSYAHVSGYYSLVYGSTGIEKASDDVLSGRADELFTRRLSDSVTGREPSGSSVVLTLDAAAQKAAWDGLAGKRGAAVALNPRTGEVLAMASRPSFDPSRLSSHRVDDIRAYYDQLNKDREAPLLNRAINATYPPGSTFKVIVAAAALRAGRTPQTRIPSPTTLLLPQTTTPLRNFGGESCGDGQASTLADAMRISCNTAFAQLGLDVGADALRQQAQAFGFGDDSLRAPTRVDPSIYPDELTPPQVGQSAIGQYEVRATPLQMAMVAGAIGNSGRVMRPSLVREVRTPELARLPSPRPEELSKAVTPEVADALSQMMQAVVADGTATSAQIPGVAVAGKTGTAQHAPGKAPHAWFIGFAPAEDPQVAVAVVVEEGGDVGSEATGGRVAAPIARQMMRAVLRR